MKSCRFFFMFALQSLNFPDSTVGGKYFRPSVILGRPTKSAQGDGQAALSSPTRRYFFSAFLSGNIRAKKHRLKSEPE
jgi:hypothetical protein